MRKIIALWLSAWLPCFVMAANVMAMQMQISPWMPIAMQHVHEVAQKDKLHTCAVCGFCSVAGHPPPSL